MLPLLRQNMVLSLCDGDYHWSAFTTFTSFCLHPLRLIATMWSGWQKQPHHASEETEAQRVALLGRSWGWAGQSLDRAGVLAQHLCVSGAEPRCKWRNRACPGEYKAILATSMGQILLSRKHISLPSPSPLVWP